jgi:hypothetical protein
VKAYVALLLFAGTPLPERDEDGFIPVPCPTNRPHAVRCNPRMNVGGGFWECPCCRISGYLLDYEMYRSNCDRWKAQNAIDQAVALLRRQEQRRAEEHLRKAEEQAEAIAAAHNLSAPARRVLRIISRSAGIARSDLQRRAHLSRSRFRTALKELRTHNLIRTEYLPSSARRQRKLFFPVTI